MAYRPSREELSSVSLLQDALPTLRERLQKCAFVRTVRPGDDYHLLVLDRQVPDVSARFFMEGFLGAEVAFDDKALTEGLYRALIAARSSLQQTLPMDRLVALDEATTGVSRERPSTSASGCRPCPSPNATRSTKRCGKRHLDRAFEVYPETRAAC